MTEFHSGPSTQLETDEEQLAPSLHLLPGGGHVAYRYRPGRIPTVVFLCGYRDEDVPWRTSLRLAARLRSDDVMVEIVGDGEHRLSRDADLARLARTLHGVLGERGV